MPNRHFTEFPERKLKSSSRQAKNPATPPKAVEKTRKFPGVPGKERDRSLGVKQVKTYPQKEGF